MAFSYPRQGQIYLVKALRTLGDTKKRPAVVVSIDLRNELSRTVLVVPFTDGDQVVSNKIFWSEFGLL